MVTQKKPANLTGRAVRMVECSFCIIQSCDNMRLSNYGTELSMQSLCQCHPVELLVVREGYFSIKVLLTNLCLAEE